MSRRHLTSLALGAVLAFCGLTAQAQSLTSFPALFPVLSQDVSLARDGANFAGFENGTNAQKVCAYNTSSSSNTVYERICLDWQRSANVAYLSVEQAGATNRSMRIMAAAGSTVQIGNADNNAQTLLVGSTSASFGTNSLTVGPISTPIATQSGTTYTVSTTDSSLILTAATTVTLTLPAAGSFTGRTLHLKTTGGGSVISATSNVVPKAGGAAATAILAATAGTWAELQSDGTNWIVMAGT